MSQRYVMALRKHLTQGSRGSLQAARGLGRRAVAIGLETLDVAKIHIGALATIETSSSRNGIIKQAEIFFAEAITPIEETHRAALKANLRLSQLNKTLDRRSVDLAASNQFLKQGINRRTAVEEALKKSAEHAEKLLNESRHLQKHLKHLAHRILSAHEADRKKRSHDLNDEIAQALLGINVGLLTLKLEAGTNTTGFKKEIASAQRVVDKSVKSINRSVGEFGK